MATYIVKNDETNREYEVYGNKNQSLDMVWLSQKCWFTTGSKVTITNENGKSKTFVKK